jgi:hypothetical protein
MTAIIAIVLSICGLALCGYLASCAGANRWLNFIDWLLLRKAHPND